MPLKIINFFDNHSTAMREKPPPPKKKKYSAGKKIKVLECSEMARFQIKKYAADASADAAADIIIT